MANHRKRMTISEQIEEINEEINAKELELNSLKATQSLSRILNIPRKKICYISPQHLNYFENEEKLHDFFSEYRVPRKPGGKSQVELFNIDIPYFLSNLPNLIYETDVGNCEKILFPSGSFWYKSKK